MQKAMRWICTLVGGLLGLVIGSNILNSPELMEYIPIHNDFIIYGACFVLLAIILYFIYPFVMNLLHQTTLVLEQNMRGSSVIDLSMQIIGLVIGLTIAALISLAFNSFPIPGIQWVISIVLYLILGYIGWSLPRQRSKEILNFVNRFRRPRQVALYGNESTHKKKSSNKQLFPEGSKLLDTSVIIDGRITDIMKTQFIEGPVIIPVYVLNELQVISDSADDLKRSKGRRGLDIVAQLQEEFEERVKIFEEDYSDLKDVDSKLIKTAKDKSFKIITNDYNLNKLASVQGIEILNINELANAVKIVVLPGEIMNVTLLKPGKEPGQAIAYLDDGTMIVVEHGRHLIGSSLNVEVTSVLQTSAGRMIFAKPKGE